VAVLEAQDLEVLVVLAVLEVEVVMLVRQALEIVHQYHHHKEILDSLVSPEAAPVLVVAVVVVLELVAAQILRLQLLLGVLV
jgi:hypothetical protein